MISKELKQALVLVEEFNSIPRQRGLTAFLNVYSDHLELGVYEKEGRGKSDIMEVWPFGKLSEQPAGFLLAQVREYTDRIEVY